MHCNLRLSEPDVAPVVLGLNYSPYIAPAYKISAKSDDPRYIIFLTKQIYRPVFLVGVGLGRLPNAEFPKLGGQNQIASKATGVQHRGHRPSHVAKIRGGLGEMYKIGLYRTQTLIYFRLGAHQPSGRYESGWLKSKIEVLWHTSGGLNAFDL